MTISDLHWYMLKLCIVNIWVVGDDIFKERHKRKYLGERLIRQWIWVSKAKPKLLSHVGCIWWKQQNKCFHNWLRMLIPLQMQKYKIYYIACQQIFIIEPNKWGVMEIRRDTLEEWKDTPSFFSFWVLHQTDSCEFCNKLI